MTKIFLLSLSFFWTYFLCSQHVNFNSQKNWSLNKKECFFAFGATQFTGDLGGRDQIGTDYRLKDIDLQATSVNVNLGFRYRFHPFFATSFVLNGGYVRGNDAYTNEIIRKSRNIHFKSYFLSVMQRGEIILFAKESFSSIYDNKGFKSMRNKNFYAYCFSGIGITFFNPKAKYQGDWIKLKALRTEGEGLEGGTTEYKLFSAIIPLGFGVKVGIGEMWRIGIEATYFKTFTDYIDDVHGRYYDPNLLTSPEAKYLSNPSVANSEWFEPGQQRGDKQNDAFYTLNLVLTKNMTYKKYRSGNYKFNRHRYKF